MPDRFYQTALNLPVRSLTGRSDFFVSKENAEAVALIDSFPNEFHGAVIFGEKGCGKTHLAHLFCAKVLEKTGKDVLILSAREYRGSDLSDVLEKSPYLVLENLEKPVDEQFLFHLINSVKSLNGFVFMTSCQPVCAWGVRLNDLMTRLKALPCVEILQPEEMLMQAVLIKQFADRQLSVSPEVIAYILKNMERSFKAASLLTQKADELSLAERRAITIPLIRKVLNELKDHL